MTSDRDMAPHASAEAKKRKDRAMALFDSWKLNHGHRIAGKPDDLQKAIRVFIFGLCWQAAQRGQDSLGFTEARRDAFYRGFISQTRALRFGPVGFTEPHEWRAQIGQLCEEYGWTWVDGIKEAT